MATTNTGKHKNLINLTYEEGKSKNLNKNKE